MKTLLQMCISVVLSACAACGGSFPPSGALQVTISGLPAGTDADVTVNGPYGFSQALTATQTLTGLRPGHYAVIARIVTVPPYSYFGTVTVLIAAPGVEISSSVTSSAAVTYGRTG